MNIAFCYPTGFNPERGGIERVTSLLANEFANRGHRVHFLHNKAINLAYPSNVTVSMFPEVDYSRETNKKWFHQYLEDHDIDIVINQCGPFGDSILYCDTPSHVKRISVIHSTPNINLNCLFSEVSRLRVNPDIKEYIKRIGRVIIYPWIRYTTTKNYRNHYQWLSDNTDSLILLSKRYLPELQSLYPGTFNNLNFIGNPCSFDICKDNIKENIVLWVGRMDIEKQPEAMVKIWQKCNTTNWKLVMLGEGPLMNDIKNRVRNIDNIELPGFKDSLLYYKQAKILCMTSGHEGFPMVLNEAMSQGCIPMAFQSFESVKDLITDVRQLSKPFSINEYASKLDRLMHNNSLQATLKNNSYQIVENYSVRKIADKWEELFSKLTTE